MKLINADLLLDKMSERCEWCIHNDHKHACRHECEWREAMDMVDDASEVETVEVVRCKDCRFCDIWESDIGEKHYCCDYNWINQETKADGFCHEGVERDAKDD